MIKEHARIIHNYLSRCLVGICEGKEALYKTVTDEENNETKQVLNYSAIDIKPLPFIFEDEFNEALYSDFNDEVGKTIIGGFKLYGQGLIDNIGVINLKVYDQHKQFIANAPFSILVDADTYSVALQEATN